MYNTDCGCGGSGLSGVAFGPPAGSLIRRGAVVAAPPRRYPTPYGFSASTRYRDTGLGYVPWGTIVGGAFDLARSLIGGSDVTSCPGQISGARLRQILTAATAAQLEQLDALCRAVKSRYPESWSWYTGLANLDLDRFAFNVQGGEDCTVTSTPGKALVSYLRELDAQTPGTVSITTVATAPFPSGSGEYSPVYDPGPLLPGSETTTPDAGPSLSLWDRFKDVVGDSARAAADAAARTAAGSTYANLPATQQAELDRYAADAYSRRAGSALSASMPLLIGAGLLTAYLVTRK